MNTFLLVNYLFSSYLSIISKPTNPPLALDAASHCGDKPFRRGRGLHYQMCSSFHYHCSHQSVIYPLLFSSPSSHNPSTSSLVSCIFCSCRRACKSLACIQVFFFFPSYLTQLSTFPMTRQLKSPVQNKVSVPVQFSLYLFISHAYSQYICNSFQSLLSFRRQGSIDTSTSNDAMKYRAICDLVCKQ